MTAKMIPPFNGNIFVIKIAIHHFKALNSFHFTTIIKHCQAFKDF